MKKLMLLLLLLTVNVHASEQTIELNLSEYELLKEEVNSIEKDELIRKLDFGLRNFKTKKDLEDMLSKFKDRDPLEAKICVCVEP